MTRLEHHKVADRLAQSCALEYGQALMLAHAISESLDSEAFKSKFGTHGSEQLRSAMLHLKRISRTPVRDPSICPPKILSPMG
jgi:hypothetical protein